MSKFVVFKQEDDYKLALVAENIDMVYGGKDEETVTITMLDGDEYEVEDTFDEIMVKLQG